MLLRYRQPHVFYVTNYPVLHPAKFTNIIFLYLFNILIIIILKIKFIHTLARKLLLDART